MSPGTAVTGFPPGIVTNGSIHAADAEAAAAQAATTTAYNDAAGRVATPLGSTDLGGQMLTHGVYFGPTLSITGTVTLDAEGDPDAVWIFQAGSTLITSSSSVVALVNGAQACNVFWQVGSSATLGTNSTFRGTILALTSITANTRIVVEGRLLARNGAVTLDSNTINRPFCQDTTTTTTTTTTVTTQPQTTTTQPQTTTTQPQTTTTQPQTTTTTVPQTTTMPQTTTTMPQTTTTTVPQTTTTVPQTTTTVPMTTTTVPQTTTTTTIPGLGTTTVAPPGDGTLPPTGRGSTGGSLAALSAVVLGAALVLLTRRSPRHDG